jgi:hypothetical protein
MLGSGNIPLTRDSSHCGMVNANRTGALYELTQLKLCTTKGCKSNKIGTLSARGNP